MRWSLIVVAVLVSPPIFAAEGLTWEKSPSNQVTDTSLRVASAGLCADQVVIPLFPREAIVGVSPQATDPDLSVVAPQAQGLPSLAPSAEALIASGASLVVLNTYGDSKTQALLERLGVRVARIPYDARLADIPASLRQFGTSLHAASAANDLAARVEARLEHLRATRRSPPTIAAYYRPDGGSAGLGTYVSDVFEIAGYRSLAAEIGHHGWGRLDLEELLLHPPQAMIISFFQQNRPSSHRNFGRHPVLLRAMETLPLVQIPGRLWGCGGWPVMTAATYLTEHRP